MKRIILFLFVSSLIIAVHGQKASNPDLSTYYLIRHAEKKISDNNDPDLHPDGILRAQQWSEVFRSIKFDAIYSTNYKRTKDTAIPTAEKNNLEIIIYNPGNLDYKQFLKDTRGKTILIVGHSNTIPAFVNNLIGKNKYGDIEYDNNGNLYIVEVKGDNTIHSLLHIN